MEKFSDLYLRVLSPYNKKEYKTVSVRGLCKDHVDTPAKLKAAISNQCDGLNPEKMDIGYFLGTKKLWINNRLDISDVWNMIDKREKVTLWCLDTSTRESLKRKRDEHGDDDDTPPLKKKSPAQGTVEERKARAKENEEKLKDLHKDKWTSFQYKLWAEMLIQELILPLKSHRMPRCLH